MEQLHFDVEINAPRDRVWKVLWDDATYPEWTRPFSEGSRAVSDWQEGSKIEFLDGTGNGMSAVIDRKVPNEFMSFKHVAEIRDGKEQPLEIKEASSALENYTLKEQDGVTTLRVDLDAPAEYKNMFQDAFPKALGRVKELAETRR